jgi:hypothetical protein
MDLSLNNLHMKLIKFSILLISLLFVKNTFAQNYAIIGSGTTTNSTTTYPAPFGNYNWGARHQFYITAAQLTAAGIPANSQISSIGFNVITDNGTTIHSGFSVKVYQTTTANPLASTYTTSVLAASSTASNFNPVAGWNQIALTSSFIWNGTSNLVIETCYNNTSSSTNAITQWTSSGLGTGTWSRWNVANAAGQCSATSSTGSSTTTRPNVRLGYIEPCLNAAYGQYPATTFIPSCSATCVFQIITDLAYCGEYSKVAVRSGNVYKFLSSTSTDYITISDSIGTISYTYGVSGTAGLLWTSRINGTVRF